jgi:tetratricopeptide (TPR) repeat protein
VDADPQLIRRAREKAGLSQAQLGAPLLTKQAVQSIEVGRVRPSPRSLAHIANRLGVPVESLLREGGPLPDRRVRELQRLCEEHRYSEVLERTAIILRAVPADARLRGSTHYYAGLACHRLNMSAAAIDHLVAARRDAAAVPDPWLAAESLDIEAAARHELNDPGASQLAAEALRQYRRLDRRQPEIEARMLENVGKTLWRRGDYQAAERSYEEALDVMGAVRALDSVGRIYHGLAGGLKLKGDLDGAEALMRKAIDLYEVEHGVRPDARDVSLAKAENDLALILLDLGRLEEADVLLTRALARLTEAGVEQLRPYVLQSISRLRQRQDQTRAAFESANEAVELSDRLDLPIPLAEGLQQIGDLEEASGHPRRADRSYRRAIEVLRNADLGDRAVEIELTYQRLLEARRVGRSEPA